jgi:uncharacterized membrane protein YsdA (DUF1294 family)/cold shock CspA family protein
MQQAGRLATWDDDRGFGFIEADGGERVFVHIKSIARLANRPRVGDRLRFEVGPGRDGRPAASNVQIAGANPVNPAALRRGLPPPPPRPLNGRRQVRLALVAALALALVAAVGLGGAPTWLGWTYLAMGFASGYAYWSDKRKAEAEQWRTMEGTLHAYDIAFGIIGGLAAQAAFNHKTAKPSFAAITFGIFGVHLAGLLLLTFGFIALPDIA